MTTLHLQVATVLYSDRTDPHIVDAHAMPSRVVAATPPGVVLDLMRLTGRAIEIESADLHSVHAAISEYVAEQCPELSRDFVLGSDPSHTFTSIPRGNTYMLPFPGQFSFGFPLAHRLEDGTAGKLLLSPPDPRAGGDRIWARYHLVCSSEQPVDPALFSTEDVERIRVSRGPSVQHGRESFLIEDESGGRQVLGWILDQKFDDEPRIDEERAFRFTRMIPRDEKEIRTAGFEPDSERLAIVANAMRDSGVREASKIPAGYSFFGQFLTHEMTHDQTAGIPTSSLRPEEIEQGRSPEIDLDSLYGGGPETTPQFFEADGARLLIGNTVEVGGPMPLPASRADLPRIPGGALANIPDIRNDSNLGLAQMHVCLLRVHNRVCDVLQESQGLQGSALFAAARTEMRRSIQAIALYDFSRRLLDPSVYQNQVSSDGAFTARHWHPSTPKPGMPVEFSVAAFRLGHSMISESYLWNGRVGEDGLGAHAPLPKLFHMTGQRGLKSWGGLPADWVINWHHFFDFEEAEESLSRHASAQFARKMGPQAAPSMHALPPHMARFGSLPKLNLVRGVRVALPSGQAAAQLLGAEPLSVEELQQLAMAEALQQADMLEETPLWLYLLCESELRAGGMHLGPLASMIVLDTLGTLIDRSADSILHAKGWTPIATGAAPTELQFADLLKFAGCEVQCRDLV